MRRRVRMHPKNSKLGFSARPDFFRSLEVANKTRMQNAALPSPVVEERHPVLRQTRVGSFLLRNSSRFVPSVISE